MGIRKKYWLSALRKESMPTISHRGYSAQKCVKLKLHASRTILGSKFRNASRLLCSEFRTPTWSDRMNSEEYILYVITHRIDSLWAMCVKDYIQFCVFSYLYGISAIYSNTNTSKKLSSSKGIKISEIISDLVEAISFFYDQREKLKDKLLAVYRETSNSLEDFLAGIEASINSCWSNITHSAHVLGVKASLTGIGLLGYNSYKYVCEHSNSTCSVCSELDGAEFRISEATPGTNLPPMHPNCRCTITTPEPLPDFSDVSDYLSTLSISEITDGIVQMLKEILDNATFLVGDIWKYLFEESFKDYYGTFTTIIVNGNEYRINSNTFSAVAIDSNGDLIVPENASEYDIQLLNLMKKRDALPENTPERAELETAIQNILDSTDTTMRKVNPKHPYSFYILGGDVTAQLHQYMRQTEVDYAYMHDNYWFNNLGEFVSLVGNSSIMDLKNQPEWQHSACIYDGEIVDQDAVGNINYGFFGRHCNIPESVLMVGAGYAQISAGTSDLEFWMTFGDDPRDSYRVMQGIDIYEWWH